MEKRQQRRSTTMNLKKNVAPFVPVKKLENEIPGEIKLNPQSQAFVPSFYNATQNTQQAPQNTLQVFQNTMQVPQNTLQAPQNTLQVPQNNLQAPQNTLQVPQNILQAPQNYNVPNHIKQLFESRDQIRSNTWSTAYEKNNFNQEMMGNRMLQGNENFFGNGPDNSSGGDKLQMTQQPETIQEVQGRVFEYAMTQQGSRFLQRALKRATLEELDLVLQEILPKIPDLMVHPYANYMCQSLFVSCSAQQRLSILKGIKSQIPQISMDKCGTHSLQGLVDLASIPQEEELYSDILDNYLYSLSVVSPFYFQNSQASHVVQKIIHILSPQMRVRIIDRILQIIPNLVCDPYGLCVIKKCIQVIQGKQRDKLLQYLNKSALELVQSPYGNYAIQAAIQEWGPEYCFSIYEQILNRVPQLSIQKYASNVIERCIETSPPILRNRFIEMLCTPDSIKMLINSNFASFVIKKALQICTQQENIALREAIKEQLAYITDKKLRAKWENFL